MQTKTMLKESTEETNEKTSHVHGLKDLILLKYLRHPKQATDSV